MPTVEAAMYQELPERGSSHASRFGNVESDSADPRRLLRSTYFQNSVKVESNSVDPCRLRLRTYFKVFCC